MNMAYRRTLFFRIYVTGLKELLRDIKKLWGKKEYANLIHSSFEDYRPILLRTVRDLSPVRTGKLRASHHFEKYKEYLPAWILYNDVKNEKGVNYAYFVYYGLGRGIRVPNHWLTDALIYTKEQFKEKIKYNIKELVRKTFRRS